MFQWLRTYRPRILAVGCYVAYTLALTLFFLYLTFPYGRIERVFLDRVSHQTPLQISLGRGAMLFPLGVRYDRATVEFLFQKEKERVQVEDLGCRVGLISLILGKLEGNCFMEIFGGDFRGIFQMEGFETGRRFFISTEARDLDLGFFNRFVGEPDLGGKGFLTLDHAWQGSDVTGGEGNAFIQLSGVSVRNLNIGGFSVEPIRASEASSRITLEGGKGRVEEIRVEGDMMDIEGTGNFLFRVPPTSSLVNLSLNIVLKGKLADNEMVALFNPNKKKGEPFRLTGKGTLKRIQWNLDGMSLPPLMTPNAFMGNP